MSHLYILGTILFTVLGQLIAKWRMGRYADQMPENFLDKICLLISLLLDPFILATYFSAFLASLCWLMVVNKFALSYAYPFTSLALVLVVILSVLIFGESITIYKISGITLIVLGIFILSKGYKYV